MTVKELKEIINSLPDDYSIGREIDSWDDRKFYTFNEVTINTNRQIIFS